MSMRGARIPLGSKAWVAEERNSALKIADQEVEEFSFSARNDFDWLNEHMAGIFDENEINVAGVFKTPGRLRTKTLASQKPETSTVTSVTTTTDSCTPLADIFSSTTLNGAPNKFTQQLSHRTHSPSILIPDNIDHSDNDDHGPAERAASPSPMRHALSPVGKLSSSRNKKSQPTATDSGFYGNQLQDVDGPKSPTTRLQSGNRSRTTSSTVLKSPPRSPTSPRAAYKMFEKKDEKVEEREQRTSRPASPIPNWAANLFIPPNEPKDRKSPTHSSLIRSSPLKSPVNKLSPKKSSPSKNYTIHSTSDNESLCNQQHGHINDEDDDMMDDNAPEDEDDEDDEARSHSPSPVRSVMRKSSLNFAPFPAREPLVHKTPGAKGSRTSNLDTSRSSYYPRTTNGKSLGSGVNEDDEDMDVGQDEGSPNTMTYTQKLQDKISKLSEQQPKAARSSKSIHGLTALPQAQNQVPPKADPPPVTTPRKSRPAPVSTTPGAFPGAEDDDWMDAPAALEPEMESTEEGLVVSRQLQVNGTDSPTRAGNTIPVNVKHMSLSLFPDTNPTMAQIKAHNKSMSISSSHNSMASLAELPPAPNSPSKSPSRSMRESPLKTVKNKLSSILKGSKSLLASSTVVSAEGKQMLLPMANHIMSAAMASTESLHTGSNTSTEPLYSDISAKTQEISELTTSPRLARKTRASTEREKKTQRDARLLREHIDKLERVREAERERARLFSEQQEKERLEQEARELELQQERGRQEELEREREYERQLERERIEREKREEQERLERECEAQRQKELKRQRELERERKLQLEREKRERELELLRQKEREREREFARQHELQLQREREEAERLEAERLEQERLEREREHQRQLELEHEREEREKREREEREAETAHQAEMEAELEAEREREMELRQREKQKALNSRRIPTPTESERPKFRVALTSPKKTMHTRQNVDEDDTVAQTPARTGASVTRPATAQSVRKEIKRPAKPVASSKSRVEPPKHIVIKPTSLYPSTAALSANLSETLDASASCSQLSIKSSQGSLKEKDNLSQSLKSSIVSSNGNSRTRSVDLTAKKREQEEQRRREAKAELERKRAAQQEQQHRSEEKQKEERKTMEAKKKARQVALERAKQTRAPPPAPRPQTAASDYSSQSQPSRPPSRVAQNPADISRPPSVIKGSLAAKRQLEEEKIIPNRNGPMYQSQDSKRRRTGDDYDEDSYEPVQQPLKNPPIRPSSALKREAPTKSAYGQSAPGTARDLFKSQPGKTVDMSQFSKGAIPFAGSAPASASQSSATGVFKTPGRTALPSNARSTSKFASRPSPRFQNGDNIELPDIETEDEDEDSEEEAARNMAIAPWADSPDLKRALILQETMDPSLIFGPPAPLNMEEVFSRNKDRWNKFRARTSSANWAGVDRLTEDDIRKDMAARDKIRRDGGWSYDLGRDLA